MAVVFSDPPQSGNSTSTSGCERGVQDLVSPQSSDELRRNFLRDTLRGPVRASVLSTGQLVVANVHEVAGSSSDVGAVVTHDPRIVMVMPTYNDLKKDRSALATVALESLRLQFVDGFRRPLTLVVADNGMSDEQRRCIVAEAQKRGIEIHIADARPQSKDRPEQRTAAYARNMALKEICGLASTDARFRGSSIALLDDDGALGPGAMRLMTDALDAESRAAAVTACATKVPDLTLEVLDKFRAQVLSGVSGDVEALVSAGRGKAKLLPPLFGQHGVDMGAIVAFSGDISAKTAFLMLRRSAIEPLLDRGGPFVTYPSGSFEDMLLGLSMSVQGRLVRQGAAKYLDQVSTDSRLLLPQKSRWGRDHVLAVNDLRLNGNILPGLHILEERRCSEAGGSGTGSSTRWVQWTVPAEDLPLEEIAGFVVCPNEVERYASNLERLIDEKPLEITQFFGAEFTPDKLKRGLEVFSRISKIVRNFREQSSDYPVTVRNDLPPPPRDHSPDSFVESPGCSRAGYAQMAGNLLGVVELMEKGYIDKASQLPQAFIFGVRQHSNWTG